MRFTRFFAAIISLIVATSCTYNDIDQTKQNIAGEKSSITISGRITAFDDYAVSTRAGKTNEESLSTSMALAIFPINDDNATLGDCISYIHLHGGNVNFTIDRADIRGVDGENTAYDDQYFALYLFANMPYLPETMSELEYKSLDWFLQQAYENNGIVRPQTGFPMVGSLGDWVTGKGDGNKFVLIPVENNKVQLPTVNETPSDYIPIPLKSLYSKFSFVVSLNPDQHIQNGAAPTFSLESYELKNIPKYVRADSEFNNQEGKDAVLDSGVNTEVHTTITEGGSIEFSFYLPERFLEPATSADEYTYPLGENSADVTGYDNVREEDKKYCQRFKPLLLDPNEYATYITLKGQYSDHQGHNWGVDYDIYLGEDNYGDFNFKRNTNYINNVVIRGITASKDQSVDNYTPFIDHRVTITRALPVIINIQRETLLDSHFEVRPLRVRYPLGAEVPNDATIKVDILNVDETNVNIPNWIRMEHNNGGDATPTHLASGKRKYFTTDLVTNTLKGNTSITLTKTDNDIAPGKNETFWIYVDQCDIGAPPSDPNRVREAMIRVTCEYTDANSNKVIESLDYRICQHLLYPVQTTRNGEGEDGSSVTYYIEYEEEYLHNFDSEGDYGTTEEAGMVWGLNNIQLSRTYDAFIITHYEGEKGSGDSFGDYVGRQADAFSTINPQPKYDFYLYRDVKNILGTHFDASNIGRVDAGYYQDDQYAGKIKINDFSGIAFNKNIADYLLDSYASHQPGNDGYNPNDCNAKINGITLDEKPKSAFAYCYNRNKRNGDGTVAKQDWYLPAIDEIEDIMEYAYGDFDTEFQGNMYWSCQPAFSVVDVKLQRWNKPYLFWWDTLEAWFYGGYYNDDITHARATQALRKDGVFDAVPSSGANAAYKREGNIYISAADSKDTEIGEIQSTGVNAYEGHPANMSRTAKARVRCVRNPSGVTVDNP